MKAKITPPKFGLSQKIQLTKKHFQIRKLPSPMTINDQTAKIDSKIFLNNMCKYFAKIGSNLCVNISPNATNNSLKIYNKTCLQSFTLQ